MLGALRLTGVLLALSAFLAAQPKKVLYVTHSAGFRHDCIPLSASILKDIAARSGRLEVVATEDVSLLSAGGLRDFDAVLFYTSGELPITDAQKQDLLAFVRGGKGFGGVHSATDTFYQWAEYGDLIGGYFNGHPWTQEVRIDIEDPEHPAVSHLKPSFSIPEEIYQFRDLSRGRVRVLMTLDTSSVDLKAPDTNPATQDFPLAWCRNYGSGRVFYNALGHLEETWRDQGFQQTMLNAMLWLTGQVEGDATPRPASTPQVLPMGVANAAGFEPRMTVSPGSLISIFGRNLTNGSSFGVDARKPYQKLAGTSVLLNGSSVPLLYVSPDQVNAYVPIELKPRECAPAAESTCRGPYYDLEVTVAGDARSAPAMLEAAAATPGIFVVTTHGTYATIWATGMGAVEARDGYQVTTSQPEVTIAGAPARVLFSGLAPGWFGLYQVNVELPPALARPAPLVMRIAGTGTGSRIE